MPSATAVVLPPPPLNEPPGSVAWQQWYSALAAQYNVSGLIAWADVNKAGSSLTDLASRNHNDLQSIQGGSAGQYYHLTSAQAGALATLPVSLTSGVTGTLPVGNGGTGNTSGTATINANLTGVITSVGNATSIASQTGTGSKFVVDTSPTLVTPLLGTPTSGTLTNCTGYTDANLSTSDVTTNNVSTSKHGFAPKSPNDATKYLDGTGAYSVPSGSSTGGNYFAGQFTRVMTTASGTQTVTGIGFTPKACVFMASKSGGYDMSSGTDDGANPSCIIWEGDITGSTWGNTAGKSIYVFDDATATNSYDGYVSAFASGQFTITWRKVGAPTGTLAITYLAHG